MKLLLTGMTAQQANPASHLRVANYAGYLRGMLQDNGHRVDWKDPTFDTDLDEYDRVILGVAPITSLGANRTYGALRIAQELWDSPKLMLMVDAPDPDKIGASLRAISDKPINLLKEFFSYRKEYTIALEHEEQMLAAVALLRSERWPTTLAPSLPWSRTDTVGISLPQGAADSITFTCVDHRVIKEWKNEPAHLSNAHWAYEPGSNSKWLRGQNLMWPHDVLPKSSRTEADSAAIAVLRNAGGCLIGPDRHGTWWNTRYGQALANRVPVLTHWQSAETLGQSWTMLPSVYERRASDSNRRLAEQQYEAYLAAIGSEAQALTQLDDALETTRSNA